MKLIELHILQSFPVSCLNRDDVGAPKTAYFGGCQRARVSSQSWKRAIRALAKENAPDLFAGCRTRLIVSALEAQYIASGLEPTKAKALSKLTADSIGKLDVFNKGNVKTLIYFSPQELKNIVREILGSKYQDFLSEATDTPRREPDEAKAQKELIKIIDKATKKLKDKVKDNADIAIFGRMVADDHSLTLEGAGLFSHALSTHTVSNEIDFFSAVDDNHPPGEAGAAHIGTIEFNSACYYRYIGLNLDLLKDNNHLGHYPVSEFQQVLTTFLKSAILAVPTARKNAMFGMSPPTHVLGLKRTGHPLSLVNAFEKPILSTNGYLESSIDAMQSHWDALSAAYSLSAAVKVQSEIPKRSLEQFIMELVQDEPEPSKAS